VKTSFGTTVKSAGALTTPQIITPKVEIAPEVAKVIASLPTKELEAAQRRLTGKVDCKNAAPITIPQIQPTPSTESFTKLIDELWSRRGDLALQPKHTMVYRLSGLEVPECSDLAPKPFFQTLKGLVDSLPPYVEAGTRSIGATKVDLSKGLGAAIDGALSQQDFAKLEWGTFRFHAKSFDPTAAQDRVFINTRPKEALTWTRWLVDEVLANPKQFPGVDVVEVAGPASAARADDLMVLTSSAEGRDKLLAWIEAKAKKNPETLESAVIPGAQSPRPGVSWGQEPDAARYPGESFRSVRARVIFNALLDSEPTNDKKVFAAAVRANMKEAGLDPDAPHANIAGTKPSTTVVGIEGAVAPKAGTIYPVLVDAWGTKVTVDLEVTPKVADLLAKRKNLAFLPDTGQIAQIEIDRTRDPPQQVIKAAFSLTHSADQRYKIEMGEAGPALLAYDDDKKAFYVPKKVKLVPSTNGRMFGVEPVGIAADQTKATEPLHKLVRQFVEPNRTEAEVAQAAAKIEKYLSDPNVTVVSSIPLEEGVNGKAIVKLSNGAVAMWKPSNAEYPEVMRPNLEPDHYARREAFAYQVSKTMSHLGRVPPAIYRDLNGQPGALIALVRNSEAGVFSDDLAPLLKDTQSTPYRSIALLDHVLGSLDRHHGNVLFTSGNCLAIDHGICMPNQHGDQGGHTFLFDADMKLTSGESMRVDALLAAKTAIVQTGQALGIHADAINLMFSRAETFKSAGEVTSYWRTAA